ncbi:MAG: AgmX/PglI C-terminal domain-containing protein [Minicystis sp.]
MRRIAIVLLWPALSACAASAPAAVSIEAPPSASTAPSPASAAPPAKPEASAQPKLPPPAAPAEARVTLREAQANGLAETAQVVTSLRPSLVRCFNTALKHDPSLSGKIVLHVKIDPTGKVTAVKLDDELGLDVELAGCLVSATRAAAFPPAPSGATLTIPLNVAAP